MIAGIKQFNSPNSVALFSAATFADSPTVNSSQTSSSQLVQETSSFKIDSEVPETKTEETRKKRDRGLRGLPNWLVFGITGLLSFVTAGGLVLANEGRRVTADYIAKDLNLTSHSDVKSILQKLPSIFDGGWLAKYIGKGARSRFSEFANKLNAENEKALSRDITGI